MARQRGSSRTGLTAGLGIFLALGGFVLLLPGGCTRTTPTSNAAPPRVRASSAALFTGDAKRLEPHFDLKGGCVRIESHDPAVWIGLEVELWQGGKFVRQEASGRSLVEGPTEASVSLQEVFAAEGKPKHKLVLATAGKSGAFRGQWTTDKLKPVFDTSKETVTITAKLEQSVDLVEGEHTPIWAILAHDVKDLRQFDKVDNTVEGGAKEAVWALVLKTWWEKHKNE